MVGRPDYVHGYGVQPGVVAFGFRYGSLGSLGIDLEVTPSYFMRTLADLPHLDTVVNDDPGV